MISSPSALRTIRFRSAASVSAFALASFGAMGAASAQEATAAAPMSAPATGGIGAAGGSDHAKVVGHMGFTWLGVNGLQIASDIKGGRDPLQAPTIGIRYWLNEGMGLDVGLGLAFSSGSKEVKNGADTTKTEDPSGFGAIVHVGVPIVLGTPGKHYTFTVIPEANIGYGSGTQKFSAPAPNVAAPKDLELSGLLINVGARVGAEIQFGFIGIPELALQGSVGLSLSRASTTGKQDTFEGTKTDLSLGTTVQSSPWGLFTNSVAAIYYF